MRHVGETRLAYSTKPSNGLGRGIRCWASSDQASEIVPGCEPCGVCAHSSRQRVSSQSFSAASEREAGRRLPDPMAGVLDVLLDLPFLPTGGRIAELRFEQEVADHGREAGVDLALLAPADLIDCSAHVVIDASPRNAAQHAEGVVMG